MKIKFSISFFIAFLSLLFLIQELHDWSHVLTAFWLCGCFGTKAFDSWSLCDHCEVAGNVLVLVYLAGGTINYILIWVGRSLMSRRQSATTRSFGFSLLFAANPFANIMAAIVGGGDTTVSIRMLYQHADGSNRQLISIISLIIVLALTIPPLIKGFNMMKSNVEKFILFPAFLLLPNLIIWVCVSKGMNLLLNQGLFQEEIFGGTPLLVLIWLFLIAVLLLVKYKSLQNFIKKKEKRGSLRI